MPCCKNCNESLYSPTRFVQGSASVDGQSAVICKWLIWVLLLHYISRIKGIALFVAEFYFLERDTGKTFFGLRACTVQDVVLFFYPLVLLFAQAQILFKN